jgi:hypothetical protein
MLLDVHLLFRGPYESKSHMLEKLRKEIQIYIELPSSDC